MAIGLFAGTAPGAEFADDLVMLPPLVVESSAPEPPWRHGRSAHYEVLSCCPDVVTEELVATVSRAHDILNAILPPRFLPPPATRDTMILLDEAYWSARSQESVAALLSSPLHLAGPGDAASPGASSSGWNPNAPERRKAIDTLDRGGPLMWNPPPLRRSAEFFRNLRLADPDGMTTFVLVSRDHLDLDGWRVSPGSLRELFARRTPQLPPWFVSGFLAVYGELRFVDGHWNLGTFPGLPAQMLPLAEFFTPPTDSDTAAIRLAQAELLVRWALDPDNVSTGEAFWRLVDQACAAPVTEAMFNDCFGFGFVEGAKRLQEFVPVAMRRPRQWRYDAPPDSARTADLRLRDAAPVEIARIKGAWERQETAYVRGHLPALTEAYLRQARRTLERGLDSASRDPAVLAELGLLEDDAGERTRARELLEEAMAAGAMRPLALVGLARLRYEEIRATTSSPPDALTEEELRPVLRCLDETVRQTPPLVETFRMLTEVRAHAFTPPSVDELSGLHSGARLFAQDVAVVDAVVSMLAKASSFEEARRLIALSLSQIEAPAARQVLEAWLARLPSPGGAVAPLE